MGNPAASLERQKVPGSAADEVWRGSPGATMQQAAGAELEREEEGIRGEWAVYVLLEAPHRLGML